VNKVSFFPQEKQTYAFGLKFVHSDAFRALFDEGMELVEETTAYLDGAGRRDSACLSPEISGLYIRESLNLTTRLMHIASWLLLERAWADGDISTDQLAREKIRLSMDLSDRQTQTELFEKLPQRLRELIGLNLRLHARILHLELLFSDAPSSLSTERDNPVSAQIRQIENAFR